MGLPLAPYFLCLHYFGSAMAHSRFSTYCPWVCFFSLSKPIQARLLPQGPLYELVSHSFLPLGLNGFFLLANFGLPVLLGFFSYWACQNKPQHLAPCGLYANKRLFCPLLSFSSSFPLRAFSNSGPQLMCVYFLSRHEQCFLFEFPSLVVILKCSLASLISFLIRWLTHHLPSFRF